jgi:hypothetical protein
MMEIMSIPVGKENWNFSIMKLPRIPVKIRIHKWPTGLDGDKSWKLKSILWTDKCQWLQTEKSKDTSITFPKLPTGIEIPWILRRKSCRQWLIPESNSADRKYISNWKQHDAINCDRQWFDITWSDAKIDPGHAACEWGKCLFKDDDSSFLVFSYISVTMYTNSKIIK